MRIHILSFAITLCMLGGCASPQPSTSVQLALDGPALEVAGWDGKTSYRGSMDRSVMAGVGVFRINTSSRECEGRVDHPASEKGRLYVEVSCSDGQKGVFVLRNLGPDQGMGVGRLEGTEERISLFYHPSHAEAERRLEKVHQDLTQAASVGKTTGSPEQAAE